MKANDLTTILEHVGAIGETVLQAFFLYLMGRIFHAGPELRGSAKKPWQKVATEIALAVIGVVGIGLLFVFFL